MLIMHGFQIAFRVAFFVGKIPDEHFGWVAFVTALLWGSGWLAGYYVVKRIYSQQRTVKG